jgi:hypothetical protein
MPGAWPQTFRAAPWLIVMVICGLVMFVACTVFMIRAQGLSFTALGLAVGSGMTLFGLADVLSMRVTLHGDAIEVFAKFRKRHVARVDVVRVVAEKGAPIALELAAGGWFKLPDLGGSLHPNTVRAWLKAD